jgi:hypothetical protein
VRDAIDALKMAMQLLVNDLSYASKDNNRKESQSATAAQLDARPVGHQFPSDKFKIMTLHASFSLTQLKLLLLELLRENHFYSEFSYIADYLTTQLWSLFDPQFRNVSRLSKAFLDNPQQLLANIQPHSKNSLDGNAHDAEYSDQIMPLLASAEFKDLLNPAHKSVLLKEFLNVIGTLSEMNATIHIVELTLGLELLVAIIKQGRACLIIPITCTVV